MPYHGGTNVKRLRVGVLDARALDVRVEVRHVDEHRAALVARFRDGAGELFLAGCGGHGHDLTRLHVGAVDGQLGQGIEAVVHVGRRS